MAALSKQQNVAVNTNKSQVYFEDASNPLVYNYKTDQWSTVTAYAGLGVYSVDTGLNIGLVRSSGTAVDLQAPTSTDPAATATLTTGEATFSNATRRIITGVRPLVTGASADVSLFYRANLNPTAHNNYLLYSEQLNNAAWTKNNATITANATAAPDGLTTADLLVGDGTVGAVSVSDTSQNHGVSAPSFITVSGYFKYSNANGRYVTIDVAANGPATYSLIIDTQNGVITGGGQLGVSGLGTLENYGIQAVSNGFYRAFLSFPPAATTTLVTVRQSDDAGNSQDGTDLGEVYVWGLQLDSGSALTPYVKSEAAATSSVYSQTEAATLNSRSGIAPFRINSRYHKVRLQISGGFTTVLGADVHYQPTGEV